MAAGELLISTTGTYDLGMAGREGVVASYMLKWKSFTAITFTLTGWPAQLPGATGAGDGSWSKTDAELLAYQLFAGTALVAGTAISTTSGGLWVRTDGLRLVINVSAITGSGYFAFVRQAG